MGLPLPQRQHRGRFRKWTLDRRVHMQTFTVLTRPVRPESQPNLLTPDPSIRYAVRIRGGATEIPVHPSGANADCVPVRGAGEGG